MFYRQIINFLNEVTFYCLHRIKKSFSGIKVHMLIWRLVKFELKKRKNLTILSTICCAILFRGWPCGRIGFARNFVVRPSVREKIEIG